MHSRESGATKTAPKNHPANFSRAQGRLHILLAVERGQSHSDDLLRGKAVNALSAPDRNLATALVLGVLRWQIQLDHQIQRSAHPPQRQARPRSPASLCAWAHSRLLHMDRIPARAAIDESVELAKQAGHRFASGMVNAVLRKLAVRPRHLFRRDLACRIAETHPAWMLSAGPSPPRLDGRALDQLLRPRRGSRHICRHGQSQPVL